MAKVKAVRSLLGELLVKNEIVTPRQLDEAVKVQQSTGERLGQVLIKLGYAAEEDISRVLEMQLGIKYVSLAGIIDPALLSTLPEQIVRRHKLVPIKKEGNQLTVAMADPLNVVAIDDLRLILGCDVEPVLAGEREIEAVIHRHYGLPQLEKAFEDFEVLESEKVQLDQPEETLVDEGPIVRLVNTVITQAVAEQASDIHIEPYENSVRVRYRVDGILREIMTLPRKSRAALVSRIKILADLNIAERRLPQDGRIQIKYGEREVDLRVSTMPTVFGEKVVIRLLDKSAGMLKVEQLGFQAGNQERFNSILKSSYGMILITGPTGSGKTTTLYAALSEISTPEKNVITIEDPVEYILPGINQAQVNPKTGFTFATGLRSIVRQDPDIIMVGEIRDRETAAIAVQAATTGHLVLTTLHTNDAAGAVSRLIDMGVEPFLVSSSLLGVVAQRLVRLCCRKCRESYQLKAGAPERAFMGLTPDEPVSLFRGKGCPACEHTGYKGRLNIQEVLLVTGKIRELINRNASAGEIKRQAVAEGMLTLQEDGIQKALQGLTTIQEVVRVAYIEEN
ncbi:MAG: type II secretion system protein GspE [Peptococcaceae bacterium]|nr:MAG: type II secretion system protein GspE [Peptococcaceae bacterium]